MGVNLDELVRLCTKLAQEFDRNGTEKLFSMVDRVSDAVKDAGPLLVKVTMKGCTDEEASERI